VSKQVELHDFPEVEVRLAFSKLILEFNAEIVPVAIAHGIMHHILNQWNRFLENFNVCLERLGKWPSFGFLELLTGFSDLLSHCRRLNFDVISLHMEELYIIVAFQVFVPVLFDLPDFRQHIVFLLDLAEFTVLDGVNIEDLLLNLVLVFLVTLLLTELLVFSDLLESLFVRYGFILGCLAEEAVPKVNDLLLEVIKQCLGR